MQNIKSIIEHLKFKSNSVISKDEGFYHHAFLLSDRKTEFSNPFPFEIPEELNQWWQRIYSAELFKDIDYGQWGLILLSESSSEILTKECLRERPDDFYEKDIVIGSFLGDSDLLVISCEKETFGNIIIAEPIDKRKDWITVSTSFADFLRDYISKEGEKYWE